MPGQENQACERDAEYTAQIFAATRSRVKGSEPRLIVEQKQNKLLSYRTRHGGY